MTEPKPTEAEVAIGRAIAAQAPFTVPDAQEMHAFAIASALAEARAAARSPAPEWRPIDQAPKDGTVILLDDGHQVTAGYYRGDDETPWALFDKDEPTGILTEPESMIIGWQHLPASSE